MSYKVKIELDFEPLEKGSGVRCHIPTKLGLSCSAGVGLAALNRGLAKGCNTPVKSELLRSTGGKVGSLKVRVGIICSAR